MPVKTNNRSGRKSPKGKGTPIEHPAWCSAAHCTAGLKPGSGGEHRGRWRVEPETTVGVVVHSQLWAPVDTTGEPGPFVEVRVEGAVERPAAGPGVIFDIDLGDMDSIMESWREIRASTRESSCVDTQQPEPFVWPPCPSWCAGAHEPEDVGVNVHERAFGLVKGTLVDGETATLGVLVRRHDYAEWQDGRLVLSAIDDPEIVVYGRQLGGTRRLTAKRARRLAGRLLAAAALVETDDQAAPVPAAVG